MQATDRLSGAEKARPARGGLDRDAINAVP
jgi:hypothetical protein